jgi:hypothetical protein
MIYCLRAYSDHVWVRNMSRTWDFQREHTNCQHGANSNRIRLAAVRYKFPWISWRVFIQFSYTEKGNLIGTFKKFGPLIAVAVALKYKQYISYRISNRNRVFSRQLPAAKVRVRFEAVCILWIFWFLLQIRIPPNYLHSLVILPPTLWFHLNLPKHIPYSFL